MAGLPCGVARTMEAGCRSPSVPKDTQVASSACSGSPSGSSVIETPSRSKKARRGKWRSPVKPSASSRAATRSGSGGTSEIHSRTGPSAGPGAIGVVHSIRNGSEPSYGPGPTSQTRHSSSSPSGVRRDPGTGGSGSKPAASNAVRASSRSSTATAHEIGPRADRMRSSHGLDSSDPAAISST